MAQIGDLEARIFRYLSQGLGCPSESIKAAAEGRIHPSGSNRDLRSSKWG
jgi:hypothetical protein